MLTQDDYRDYCKRFRTTYKYLQSKSADPKLVAYNICALREYDTDIMSNTLVNAGFLFIEGKSDVFEPLRKAGDDLGLFNKDGRFLLSGRFIFPVKDMLGNVVALIGWFPDEKKYITTPSKLFSKSCMFYGMEQLVGTGLGNKYWITEGIFDSLSLRAIGKNAIAEMGIASSRVKEAMYPMFKSVYAVPDNDESGRNVIDADKWKLPMSGKYLKIVGKEVKDIDDVIKSYDTEDVLELLSDVEGSNERIYIQKL